MLLAIARLKDKSFKLGQATSPEEVVVGKHDVIKTKKNGYKNVNAMVHTKQLFYQKAVAD